MRDVLRQRGHHRELTLQDSGSIIQNLLYYDRRKEEDILSQPRLGTAPRYFVPRQLGGSHSSALGNDGDASSPLVVENNVQHAKWQLELILCELTSLR